MANRAQTGRLSDGASAVSNSQVQQIANRVSAEIGAQFFHSMTEQLAKVLEADYAYTGEFVGGRDERVRTLSAWVDGHPESLTYELAGSASANLAFGKQCICRSRALDRFPDDPLFAKWQIQACVGIPLLDSRKLPLGLIMLAYRKSIRDTQLPKEVLSVFAPRAAGELERRQHEERLRESEQRYRAFISMNTDALWRIEFEPPVPTSLPEQEQLEAIYRDGYIAESNDALASQLGIASAQQLIGTKLSNIGQLSNPSVRNATLQAIHAGYRFNMLETNPVGPDGKRRYMLRSQWGIVDAGMLQRLWGSTRDITKLKQSEMELDASEMRFAGLMQSLPLVVLMMASDGTIDFANDHFYRLTGWQQSDVTGRNWLDLMIPTAERARVRSAIAATATEPPRPVHFQSPLVGFDGNRHWIAWDCVSLRDSDDKAETTAVVGCDITEYKALEAQYHQAQKLEHLGRMTGGIAHDFNNLLTIIMGHAGLLLERTRPSDPLYESLDQILRAAEKGAELTQRLFSFSRHRVLRPEVLNPALLIAEDERMIRQLVGENIRVVTQFESAPGFVKVDAGHLHQIILNLVVNARDAMPGGGALTISTSSADPDYIQITVADTGTGMTDEVRSHLFEPFYTTKDVGKGTGLGLATVYGIVQQSGGRLEVESGQDAGTTLRIFLPRIEPQPTPEPAAPNAKYTPRGTETILLMETQPEVRTLGASILRDLGYSVLEAQSPAQAMEIASKLDADAIQILLTGVDMPGAAACDLADIIKASRRNLRILFMSGYLCPEDMMRDLSERGYAWLQKPFTPEALAIAVRELLDQP